jgi:hypothetical protein
MAGKKLDSSCLSLSLSLPVCMSMCLWVYVCIELADSKIHQTIWVLNGFGGIHLGQLDNSCKSQGVMFVSFVMEVSIPDSLHIYG